MANSLILVASSILNVLLYWKSQFINDFSWENYVALSS